VAKTVNDAAAGTSETTIFVGTTHPLPFSPYAGQVLAEYHSGAAVTDPERKYAYGTYIDEPLVLLSTFDSEPSTHYYHQNCLYTVTALTDSTGTAVERYAYTPYGEVTFLDASANLLATQRSTVDNAYTFTGRRRDKESGACYYRARYYASRLGRFTCRDPLGLIWTSLLYGYTANTSQVDPSGMFFSSALCLDECVPLGCQLELVDFAYLRSGITPYDVQQLQSFASQLGNMQTIVGILVNAGLCDVGDLNSCAELVLNVLSGQSPSSIGFPLPLDQVINAYIQAMVGGELVRRRPRLGSLPVFRLSP